MEHCITDYSRTLVARQSTNILFGGSLIIAGWVGLNVFGVYKRMHQKYSFSEIFGSLAVGQILLLSIITVLICVSVFLPVSIVRKRLISVITFDTNNSCKWVLETYSNKKSFIEIQNGIIRKKANFWYYLFFDNKTATFSMVKEKGTMIRYEVKSAEGEKYLLIPLLFENPGEITELINGAIRENKI